MNQELKCTLTRLDNFSRTCKEIVGFAEVANDISVILAAFERANQGHERLKAIRELCGYVQDGSDTTIKIYQDDATTNWFCKVGEKIFWSGSFDGAIDNAIIAQNPSLLPPPVSAPVGE